MKLEHAVCRLKLKLAHHHCPAFNILIYDAAFKTRYYLLLKKNRVVSLLSKFFKKWRSFQKKIGYPRFLSSSCLVLGLRYLWPCGSFRPSRPRNQAIGKEDYNADRVMIFEKSQVTIIMQINNPYLSIYKHGKFPWHFFRNVYEILVTNFHEICAYFMEIFGVYLMEFMAFACWNFRCNFGCELSQNLYIKCSVI
jgi:hypothetical protein